ncbi:MAG: heme lyase CcmF/NrfE family subunit [Alphaproteobacteria bacterium]|nr:heme lyase CcmF/NrfE family subunit [Alphaproteobacteria bacterium]
MFIETGHFALILALLVAAVQAFIGLRDLRSDRHKSSPLGGRVGWGVSEEHDPPSAKTKSLLRKLRFSRLPPKGRRRDSVNTRDISDTQIWIAAARRTARAQCALIAIAFVALAHAYVTSDFSVLNVAQNSHIDKPLLYKISGVWGNHEGSMLLWVLVLALYGAALALFGKKMPTSLQMRALGVQGILSAVFLLFILLTSNPFMRLNPAPLNGQGLNPILQDPGLAFHPPCLYLGYVGFSLVFALAVAALMEGRVDSTWARAVRPWALAAWSFLTLGIGLGSWWAYYTLGWGGWWYWDPVENASFIPWLAGTALLHSLIVLEKRDVLKAWTVLLAIITFSLSLIGTFLVRSGVLTSVHSFASDPARGVFILGMIVAVTGSALLLFLLRAPTMKSGADFAPLSREGSLLLNNVLLSTAAGTVLLGTLYPLFLDALSLGKVSVGPPYFNRTFGPLMLPLIIAMGIGPMLGWKKADARGLVQRLGFALLAALTVMAATWIWAGGSAKILITAAGMGLAAWLGTATFLTWAERISLFRTGFGEALRNAAQLPLSAYGMLAAHAGMAVLLAGITGSLGWQVEKIQMMRVGESVDVATYRLKLEKVEENIQGPNYTATRAAFVATKNGGFVARLTPERRMFTMPPQLVTDAAIHTNFIGDLYAVIGEADGKGNYVTRLYYNPLVPWIFFGVGLMALGGTLALAGRRKNSGATEKQEAARSGKTSRRAFLIPLMAFAVLAGFFANRLWLAEKGFAPDKIPSALIGKPVPVFDLPSLTGGHVTAASFKGKVTLVNFFASWCVPCRAEHEILSGLKSVKSLTLVGINYKDRPEQAQAWLRKSGNPFSAIANDREGTAAIDFGVYGIPESFLIDRQGIIRFRQAGILTPEAVQNKILPLVKELNR